MAKTWLISSYWPSLFDRLLFVVSSHSTTISLDFRFLFFSGRPLILLSGPERKLISFSRHRTPFFLRYSALGFPSVFPLKFFFCLHFRGWGLMCSVRVDWPPISFCLWLFCFFFVNISFILSWSTSFRDAPRDGATVALLFSPRFYRVLPSFS